MKHINKNYLYGNYSIHIHTFLRENSGKLGFRYENLVILKFYRLGFNIPFSDKVLYIGIFRHLPHRVKGA